MKSVGETLAELILSCVEGISDSEREDLYFKKNLEGKCVEFVLPDDHEAVVIKFSSKEDNWISYKSYSTPEITCIKCNWNGKWEDLAVEEKPLDLTGRIFQEELFTPIKRVVQEKCIKCGNSELKFKDWKYNDADLVFKGSFADIGSVAGILSGGILTRLKSLYGVLIMMIKGRISIKPLRKLGLGLKVSQLITGDVSKEFLID
ncbi:MAG: hypothetical protein EAX96_13550 [Candidatus Lokiarchaeota archaeon]|nr:hypothetical protein [Candidatus Lokiarchaeota archaeon]